MIFYRLIFYGIWLIGLLAVVENFVSAGANVWRQLGSESIASEPHYSCGAWGECDPFVSDSEDLASLQRGLQTYANYCLGCHSLQYARGERIADDLQIPHDIFRAQILLPGQKLSSHMVSTLKPEDGKNWFGTAPPDLTMHTRVKGADWVYTYLRAFVKDASRPTGYNNMVFPLVAMPNVLASLQGEQQIGCKMIQDYAKNGGIRRDPITGEDVLVENCHQVFVTEDTGQLSEEEFDTLVYDLVNFLAYTAEPYKNERQRIGGYVILWLLVFTLFSFLLYREYSKDYKSI